MSRQIINRILLGIFVVLLFVMCLIYAKQEYKIKALAAQQAELEAKAEKLEFLINEYTILVDNVNSRNYIIRMAREMFGWVFDNETVYKRIPEADPSSSPKPTPVSQ